MNKFEHEVLSFDISSDKLFAKMRDTLREWGRSGFEVVSVVPGSTGFNVVNVFLKRVAPDLPLQEGASA